MTPRTLQFPLSAPSLTSSIEAEQREWRQGAAVNPGEQRDPTFLPDRCDACGALTMDVTMTFIGDFCVTCLGGSREGR